MISSIIYTLCLVVGSMIFGYCMRLLHEQEAIAKQAIANKQKKLLEQQKILEEIS